MNKLKHYLLASMIIISCSDKSVNDANKDVPEALQEKSSYEISSRSSYDVFEDLYREIVTKSPELKKFETELRKIQISKADSVEAFENYDSKNQYYYNSVYSSINQITDSLLKQQLRSVVDASMKQYKTITIAHDNLLKEITSRESTINNLHTIIKVRKTLPVIEKFQKDKIPSTMPIKGYLAELSKILPIADTLAEK